MINLKEPCYTCPKIDGCLKAVESNINNIFLPTKQWINCVNFEYLESTVSEYVRYEFANALMNSTKENNYV